jgi:hypothetical protein
MRNQELTSAHEGILQDVNGFGIPSISLLMQEEQIFSGIVLSEGG